MGWVCLRGSQNGSARFMNGKVEPAVVNRERRRKQRSVSFALMVVGFTAALGVKVGFHVALLGSVSAVAVILAATWLWILLARRQELARRLLGQAPSYAAQLPVRVARRFGLTPPSKYKDHFEFSGQLYCLPDRLRWVPAKSVASQGVGPLEWNRSDIATVTRIWGLVPLALLQV
jgi:hypothetical protein